MKGISGRLLVVGGIMMIGVAVASVLPGAPLERWAQRLFEAQTETRGLDITAMTRAGEARFQLDHLASSVIGLLFGFGISAPTAFDPDTAKLIEALVGSNTGYFSETGIGHNNYVGVIFVGGILAGGAFLWLHLMGAVKAVKVIGALSQPILFTRFGGLIAAPLAYYGYLAFGFLGGTNAIRGSSLLMGITLGLVLWIYDALHEPPPAVK